MYMLTTPETAQIACAMHAERIAKALRALGIRVALRGLSNARTCESCASNGGSR